VPKRKKAARELRYWRVVIVYTDNETSGNRVFKDRGKAEQWAARQEKSPVVRKVSIKKFVRQLYRWRESR
jgi:hypothetical protein